MTLQKLSARHKRAYVNQTTQFFIQDQQAFGRFAVHLITAENFTWNLKSNNLVVQAVKFPIDHGISFNKDLTLPGKVLCRFFTRFRLTLCSGINSFNNKVVLKELLLPSDNQLGGIDFVATTSLHNLRYYLKNLKDKKAF
jgi:hypothetical protein